VQDCQYTVPKTPDPVNFMYHRVANSRPDVKVLDLDTLVCPQLPTCLPVERGLAVRWDYQHLATAFSSAIGDDVNRRLKALGAFRS